MNRVTVRWHDGYLEEFNATEVRFGSDLLWMRLEDGNNRHIPLRSVRWFGMSQESHQSVTEQNQYPKKKDRYIRLQDAITLPVLPVEFRAEFRSTDEAFEAGWKQALKYIEANAVEED